MLQQKIDSHKLDVAQLRLDNHELKQEVHMVLKRADAAVAAHENEELREIAAQVGQLTAKNREYRERFVQAQQEKKHAALEAEQARREKDLAESRTAQMKEVLRMNELLLEESNSRQRDSVEA